MRTLGAGGSEIFEREISVGRLVSNQEDSLIQALVLHEVSNRAGLRLGHRDTAIVPQELIKPSIRDSGSMHGVKAETRFAKVNQAVEAGSGVPDPGSASLIEKYLSSGTEVPFEFVQLGDLAKPI